MKKIVFSLLLLISLGAAAQVPTGYTGINARYEWLAGKFKALNIPVVSSLSLQTGQYTGAGALVYYTVDSSVYVYTGTQFIKVIRTTSGFALTDSIRGVIVQATPDDTGEDSTAFQNAVASGAKNIYVMPGTYVVNATITLNKQNLIALGGGTVVLKTTRTTGATFDGNTVFNVVWAKDSCVVDGINFLGSGRDGSYAATYTIQNAIRISGNGNDIRNCKMHNMKGAGIYMFDEAFDAFYDNRITNITVDSSTVGYFNYYYGEYSIFSNSTIKDCRLGIIEYGNNNHIADVNVVWCTKAGIFNNGVGDDHGFISGCSFNHSGEIEFNSIDYGYNVSACQFYYTDIKCVNSDKVIIDNASFFNMAFNISGTSTTRTTTISNSYIYNNVTTNVTGTGVLVKSGARGENLTDISLEAVGGLGLGKISVKPDSLILYPPLGLIRIDSLASSNNASDSMLVWNPSTQMVGKRVISGGGGGSGWGLTGNSVSGTDYLGTTSNNSLKLYTNGVQRGYLDSATASLFLSGATVDARVKLTGQYSSTIDLNTGTGGVPYIQLSAPAYLYAGGNNSTYLTNSLFEINNAQLAVDFKVSGQSSKVLLYADATTNSNVGVGTSTPASSAKLDVVSTTQGFLPPRMTTIQRTSISSPAEGLCVYDTTLHKLYVYDGTTWQAAW